MALIELCSILLHIQVLYFLVCLSYLCQHHKLKVFN
ncbi:hypothetical protein EVA_10844 [gut metagenome]|uniref:Uncharacterized protein n=1 Tax=gut metagenome TaxID=749906 RepID=J9GMK8_9ZZZZ